MMVVVVLELLIMVEVVVLLMVVVGEGVVVALLVFQFLPCCCPKVNTIRLKKRCTFEWLVLPMNQRKTYKNLRRSESPSKVLSFGANLVLLSFFV